MVFRQPKVISSDRPAAMGPVYINILYIQVEHNLQIYVGPTVYSGFASRRNPLCNMEPVCQQPMAVVAFLHHRTSVSTTHGCSCIIWFSGNQRSSAQADPPRWDLYKVYSVYINILFLYTGWAQPTNFCRPHRFLFLFIHLFYKCFKLLHIHYTYSWAE